MKKHVSSVWLFSLCLLWPLASCSDTEDEGGGGSGTAPAEITSSVLPSVTDGFSPIVDNGVVTYYVENEYLDDDEPKTYMAFEMTSGSVKEAALNLVFDKEGEAKQWYELFSKLTVEDLLYEDDDDYDDDDWYSASLGKKTSTLQHSSINRNVHRLLSNFSTTSASGERLDLSVSRRGKVVYFDLETLKGVHKDDLKNLIYIWTGAAGWLVEYPQLEHFVFGSYDERSGVYTAPGIYNIKGTAYRIETSYNSEGYLNKFNTIMTLPSAQLAQFIAEEFADLSFSVGTGYIYSPNVSLSGNTITVEAAIIGDITPEMTLSILYQLDATIAQPFSMIMAYSIF